MNKDDIDAQLSSIFEKLAAIEHDRWSHWQRYMHSKCSMQADGSLLIPPNLVAQWERLIALPYDHLDEDEKNSDREQVQRYLPVIRDTLERRSPIVP
ncbi:hypothetical protein NKH48_20130 [Mesorhizobium sp. M1233]|uniref:hypothetical protein n=1 Tax=Mesorhizobium sp. M1233 TaxID=2957072 RepID=UPI003337448A